MKNEIKEIALSELQAFRNSGVKYFQAESRVASKNDKKCNEIGKRYEMLFQMGIALPAELIPTVYIFPNSKGEMVEALGEGFHRVRGLNNVLNAADTIPVYFREFESLAMAELAARDSNAADLGTCENFFQVVISIVAAMARQDITIADACALAGLRDMKETTFKQYRAVINKMSGSLASLRTIAANGDANLSVCRAVIDRYEISPPESAKANKDYIAGLVEEAKQDCPAFNAQTAVLVAEKVKTKAQAEAQAEAEAAEKAAEAAEKAEGEEKEKAQAEAEAAEKAAEKSRKAAEKAAEKEAKAKADQEEREAKAAQAEADRLAKEAEQADGEEKAQAEKAAQEAQARATAQGEKVQASKNRVARTVLGPAFTKDTRDLPKKTKEDVMKDICDGIRRDVRSVSDLQDRKLFLAMISETLVELESERTGQTVSA